MVHSAFVRIRPLSLSLHLLQGRSTAGESAKEKALGLHLERERAQLVRRPYIDPGRGGGDKIGASLSVRMFFFKLGLF